MKAVSCSDKRRPLGVCLSVKCSCVLRWQCMCSSDYADYDVSVASDCVMTDTPVYVTAFYSPGESRDPVACSNGSTTSSTHVYVISAQRRSGDDVTRWLPRIRVNIVSASASNNSGLLLHTHTHTHTHAYRHTDADTETQRHRHRLSQNTDQSTMCLQ